MRIDKTKVESESHNAVWLRYFLFQGTVRSPMAVSKVKSVLRLVTYGDGGSKGRSGAPVV